MGQLATLFCSDGIGLDAKETQTSDDDVARRVKLTEFRRALSVASQRTTM